MPSVGCGIRPYIVRRRKLERPSASAANTPSDKFRRSESHGPIIPADAPARSDSTGLQSIPAPLSPREKGYAPCPNSSAPAAAKKTQFSLEASRNLSASVVSPLCPLLPLPHLSPNLCWPRGVSLQSPQIRQRIRSLRLRLARAHATRSLDS